MSRPVLLNNIDHRDLRVASGRGAALGDALMSALTFPNEFRNVQAHYPIVFQKDAQGGFQPVALLGLEAGHNLFLHGDAWDAHYVPLAVERQPFLIGLDGEQRVIHIDLDHPRVRTDGSGEALFREHGGTTDYLEQVNSVLQALDQGLQGTPAFIAALLQHNLLESFVLDYALRDGSQRRLSGFYTVNEDRLAALDAAALQALSAASHLLPLYMTVASLSQFRGLIERARHVAADA
ncbi:SapC protein [Pseudoxanthomonas sp. GM95]|uniref:SapC family protein n=1 Tax=Pseudoxanthomonas sp. GM95 TaxID=1881043 RepID=UPI0008BC3B3A|nr:SapC family protein [Pseudoxanthomonas sp. GM95]SEM17247.1 SapC protein [Pseudoxanthomonas sp. GM95]